MQLLPQERTGGAVGVGVGVGVAVAQIQSVSEVQAVFLQIPACVQLISDGHSVLVVHVVPHAGGTVGVGVGVGLAVDVAKLRAIEQVSTCASLTFTFPLFTSEVEVLAFALTLTLIVLE